MRQPPAAGPNAVLWTAMSREAVRSSWQKEPVRDGRTLSWVNQTVAYAGSVCDGVHVYEVSRGGFPQMHSGRQ